MKGNIKWTYICSHCFGKSGAKNPHSVIHCDAKCADTKAPKNEKGGPNKSPWSPLTSGNQRFYYNLTILLRSPSTSVKTAADTMSHTPPGNVNTMRVTIPAVVSRVAGPTEMVATPSECQGVVRTSSSESPAASCAGTEAEVSFVNKQNGDLPLCQLLLEALHNPRCLWIVLPEVDLHCRGNPQTVMLDVLHAKPCLEQERSPAPAETVWCVFVL